MRRESFTPLIWWDKEVLRRNVSFQSQPSCWLVAGGDLLDVETPGVVLVIRQADPFVLSDDGLVQTEDCLVTSLDISCHRY